MKMGELSGGCQCGEIRYTIRVEPIATSVCHCMECKRQSGSAFGMSMIVPRDGFELTSGEPRIFRRQADSGGTVACAFCPSCGTRIYHLPSRLPESVNVKPGTLDDPSSVRPVIEIWTARRMPWLEIDGDLPEFEGNPG
jgi:hypothetical protein